MGENGRGAEGVCGLGEDGVNGGQGTVSCALIHIDVYLDDDDDRGRKPTKLSKTTTGKRPQGGQSERLFANRRAISSAHPRRRRHRTAHVNASSPKRAPTARPPWHNPCIAPKSHPQTGQTPAIANARPTACLPAADHLSARRPVCRPITDPFIIPPILERNRASSDRTGEVRYSGRVTPRLPHEDEEEPEVGCFLLVSSLGCGGATIAKAGRAHRSGSGKMFTSFLLLTDDLPDKCAS